MDAPPELRRSPTRLARAAPAVVFSVLFALSPTLVSASPSPAGEVGRAASEPLASVLPPSFTEDTLFAGQVIDPIAVRFLADGRAFVAQKNGVIKVFDNVSDTTPVTFANLSTNVDDFWDRGMLGFALDPGFLTGRPYVYVLYAFDAPIGGTAPTWGDACPTPPGPTGDGCVISARLSKLTASGNVMSGPENVLINDWCQQYPSHSIGSLAFGADGALYVSGGDGASFNFADYGQDGNPLNPCGDPPSGVGGIQSPPTAEGGALRSQDLRTPGDPTSLDGAILRLDPDTGLAAAGNPLIGSADANARRIIAHGFRNPFRFTIRPGTSEVWIGDVGWNDWEEIDRIVDPLGTVENFGWPCYEGNGRQPGYDNANLNICENLYAAGSSAVASPYYAYDHAASVVSGDTCPTGGSSIAGLAFYQGGSYPATYNGALFFADYSRDCIWVMFAGSNGLPDPANRAVFVAQASNPVDLQVGPGGDLFYANLDGDSIQRIRYGGTPPPPPPGGVTAAYAFNEGTGATATDASGTGLNGTLMNGTSWGGGHTAGAVQLDGVDDFVDLGNPAALQLTGSMTVSAWINSAAYPEDDAAIVSKRSGAEIGYQLDTTVDKGSRTIGFKLTNSSGGQMFRYGAQALQSNTWYHVAGVYDAGARTLHVYLNGQLDDGLLQGTVTATQQNAAVNANIGRRPFGSYLTNGRIDDVRIYNRPLTQAEIQADMSAGVAPSGDTENPSVPTAVSATASTQNQINISWIASLDNVGVVAYPIERCQGAACTSFVEIAAPAASPYADTGLNAGTTYRYRLRARDAAGNLSGYSTIATATTQGVANTAPSATITTPVVGTTWKVGDVIAFSGSASDSEDGTIPTSGLTWTLVQQHCPAGQTCHSHTVQTFSGTGSGSFVTPDHDYPSYLDLTLTATDAGGLTDTETVRLDPRTVLLTFQSNPSGLRLTVGSSESVTTFTRTVIEGSTNSISAPTSQTLGGSNYSFVGWSDGGSATHNIVANASATYNATYQPVAAADLRLIMTGLKTGTTTATWTLGVTNLGPNTAQNVTVTDALPSRLSFVSASAGCVYASSTRTVTCSTTSLGSSSSISFTVTTAITGSAGGWITNGAQVTSATFDPSTANNSSSDRVKAR